MPPATYEAALADPGFLSLLGSMYQQANQFEIAQGLLERSAKLQIAAGVQPGMALQLQLAAIYLQRNNTAQAYGIYRQVLQAHPDRADAWKGLISTLQSTNRTSEALQEIALIPAAVRKQLETDFDFVQSEASLYAAANDIPHAIEYMNRVEAHYSQLRTQAPAAVEIQNAWLLFNIKNDRALYPALMRLGSRQDLTVPQRETVQAIWANWSVRRAGAAIDNNDNQRAVEILEAAAQAFPDNVTVRKILAGGYLRTGRAKDALSIYKGILMQDAGAADFQGAIGAALGANDKTQAEVWLRQALDRFPKDAGILGLAARFEQTRGDNQRAADYWRASLAAMPEASPTDRLAHELVNPDSDNRPHRAATAADLQRLLDPSYEPFPKTTKLPPLPAYGADPYNGSAPVNPSQPVPQQNLWMNAPAAAPVTPLTSLPAPPFSSAGPQTDSSLPGQMAFNEQRATPVVPQAAGRPAHASARTSARTKKSAAPPSYAGQMRLPSSEENITSASPEPVPATAHPLSSQLPHGRLPSMRLGREGGWIPVHRRACGSARNRWARSPHRRKLSLQSRRMGNSRRVLPQGFMPCPTRR